MSTDDIELTAAFVQSQREWLEAERDRLLQGTIESEAEERDLSRRHADEVQDAGDAGAIEALRDTADVLNAQGASRLGEIERALEKIAEGSYGRSDESGDPIARARLEAIPEARFTVEEEALRER